MKFFSFSRSLMLFLIYLTLNGCSKEPPAAPEQASDSRVSDTSGKLIIDVFRDVVPQSLASKEVKEGGRCFVDSLNGQSAKDNKYDVTRDGLMSLSGWFIDLSSSALKTASVELVSLDGVKKYYAPAQRSARPGLGNALGNTALDNAGFLSNASLGAVGPGQYTIRLVGVNDGPGYRCDPNVLLIVK